MRSIFGTLDRHMSRRPARFPYALVEAVLIAFLAVQAARLVWTVVTPLGPFGPWIAGSGFAAKRDGGILTRFDPFFRLSGSSGPTVVTSAPIKLFGVRLNEATGKGAAIVATPDGLQSSYAVGDMILPGVTLAAVARDHVTILRNGTSEVLYLDQSVAAPVVQPPSAPATPPKAGAVL